LDFFGLSLSMRATHRSVAAAHALDGRVAWPAARFRGFGQLAGLVYSRTAATLDTIARVYGQERLQQALGRYARRYRFDHPEPEHLLHAVSESVGREAAEQLRLALVDGGWVDYVAGEIHTVKESSPGGFLGKDENTTPSQTTSEWISQTHVIRRGTLELPVEIELTLEEGSTQRRTWNGRGDSHRISLKHPQRVVALVVDPDTRIGLDQNLLNNATSTGSVSTPRVSERLSYWAAIMLRFAGP
jgi:hypothetical protein